MKFIDRFFDFWRRPAEDPEPDLEGVQVEVIPVSHDDLTDEELASLARGRCPDCSAFDLAKGPRGGMCQNKACRNCGAEFNDCGFIGHRSSPKGQPNRSRLLSVYGIDML